MHSFASYFYFREGSEYFFHLCATQNDAVITNSNCIHTNTTQSALLPDVIYMFSVIEEEGILPRGRWLKTGLCCC